MTEHKHHSPMDSTRVESPLAKDPVCGMSVDPAMAKHRAEHGGKTFFFCSGGCRGKFLADPARFLAEPTRAP
ncbi:MAG TPA: YHS domain-containing protein, partial [Roseiarcus sp.]|nr:YHS domain-containing protein [Roseiarcus sp.]